jgi:hypothetical protein
MLKTPQPLLTTAALLLLTISCGKPKETSELNSTAFSCPTIELASQPEIQDDGVVTTVSVEVEKTGSLTFCSFGAFAQTDAGLSRIALGAEDIFHRSPATAKIDFRIFSTNMPSIDRLQLATLERFDVKQIFFGADSQSSDQGQDSGTDQASPDAQDDSTATDVSCAFNINGVLYEGDSQEECDRLKDDLGLSF